MRVAWLLHPLQDMNVAKISIGVVLVLVAAAIGRSALQKAAIRSREAAATADTRRVISAEATYASANGGFFDDVSRLCRSGPDCLGIGIPDYPESAPEFLEPELARPTPYRKDHYLRKWVGMEFMQIPGGLSPTSVADYCYISMPGNWIVRHGRSFSGMSTGSVVDDPEGSEIPCPVPSYYHWGYVE